jgi:hypothetical protein
MNGIPTFAAKKAGGSHSKERARKRTIPPSALVSPFLMQATFLEPA